ncbi:MAG TPA: alpha/beta hydrolase [Ktedonobacterales bacterium]|nr:alpha/beta hydrolase [Ktedonobacterales bacterium]
MADTRASQPVLREDTLGIGSLSLHFASWGQRTTSERTTILIHGLTASSREFTNLGPALAACGWYVIAPDLRGRGKSAKPAHGYGVPFHANDVLSLCDHFGLTRVQVVGHSLGAVIGAYLAALYPERVEKLVMIDAGGVIPDDTQQAISASVNRLGTSYPSLDAYLGLMRQLPMIQWNDLWEEYFRYDAEVHPDGSVTSRVPRQAIQEETAALAALRTEDLPKLVRQPTLILRAGVGLLGPDRGLILPREEAERLRLIMSDCRVVEIPDANHYTIVEAPLLRTTVTEFLTTD